MPEISRNAYGQLRNNLGREWKAIEAAHNNAGEVQNLIQSELEGIVSSDSDVVVFGSLARQEWTCGSDVDWTLLIDGQAMPEHRLVSQRIEKRIGAVEYQGAKLLPPGGTGIFGHMAFSHEIIHNIGGQSDSNKNTTQRILLLLESTPLRPATNEQDVGAHGRVVRAIIDRYLHDDSNFVSTEENGPPIPRFLLNDIVRFWRTMCVDFACKEWEQSGEKWALRNIKLRMSRKLIFVSGLMTVFSCAQVKVEGEESRQIRDRIRDHLVEYVALTPIEIIARALTRLSLKQEAGNLVDCYNEFLEQLNDQDVRDHLNGLKPESVYKDTRFLELRKLSHRFQDVLSEIFFVRDTPLREFTRQFGLF